MFVHGFGGYGWLSAAVLFSGLAKRICEQAVRLSIISVLLLSQAPTTVVERVLGRIVSRRSAPPSVSWVFSYLLACPKDLIFAGKIGCLEKKGAR